MNENLGTSSGYNDASRSSLAYMVANLLNLWSLTDEVQLNVLGLGHQSQQQLVDFRSKAPLPDSRDLVDRVGILLGIHKSLRIIFPENRDLAYSWMNRRNRHFDELTPIEVICQYGFQGLLMVRAYLDKVRGQ